MAIKLHNQNLIKQALIKVDSILPRIADIPPQFSITEAEERRARAQAKARAEGQREHNLFQMYKMADKLYGNFPESQIRDIATSHRRQTEY